MRPYLLPFFLFLPSVALAANDGPCCREKPPWYVGVSGFVVFLEDYDAPVVDASGATLNTNPTEFTAGMGGAVAVGYALFPAIRLEVEGFVRDSEAKDNIASDASGTSGKYVPQRSFGAMGNVIWSYVNDSGVKPYIGAGAGYAYVRSPYKDADTNEKFDKWAPAYQFMGGVTLDMTSRTVGRNEISVGYRYFATDDIEENFPGSPVKLIFEDTSHNIELGWRLYY